MTRYVARILMLLWFGFLAGSLWSHIGRASSCDDLIFTGWDALNVGGFIAVCCLFAGAAVREYYTE